MNTRIIRHLLAWGAVVAMIAPAIGDTITTKAGDTIRGTVRQFRSNHHSTASSAFVVEVDGKEQTIPLHKIETITFDPGSGTASPQLPRPTVGSSTSAEGGGKKGESGSHWLTTSSHKRHNAKCRYYKTGKGRPCGADEGIPCKVCGG